MAIWYHGTATHLMHFSLAGGRSDGGNFLFLSQSPNVARRYGPAVVSLNGVNHQVLPRMTVTSWLNGSKPPATDFVITGETDSFDFPVDTLVLRSDPGVPFIPVPQQLLDELDDGRALFEPQGPMDVSGRFLLMIFVVVTIRGRNLELLRPSRAANKNRVSVGFWG